MSVLQSWIEDLSMMQQSVLLTAVRGPDGVTKYHPSKYLLRWYRRCVLLSAMDGTVLDDPCSPNGGSFTGPSVRESRSKFDKVFHEPPLPAYQAILEPPPPWRSTWQEALDDSFAAYLRCLDELPHHFQLHLMHAVEIVGYKHPNESIAAWWAERYVDLAHDMHLHPESEQELDLRLGDDREQWLARNHKALVD